MKIYNEIITIFNDETQQWETIYEDSYDYDGPLEMRMDSNPDCLDTGTNFVVVGGTVSIVDGTINSGDKMYFQVEGWDDHWEDISTDWTFDVDLPNNVVYFGMGFNECSANIGEKITFKYESVDLSNNTLYHI